MEWLLVVRAGPLKTDTWASKPTGPEESCAPAKCALDKNRTRQQKGLRDRNSPTCTLSQNGYGDNCSQTSEPRSMLSAIIPCSVLLCSDGFFCVRALARMLARKCLQCCLCWPCGKPLSATVRHNDVATNQLITNQSCR